MKKQECAGSIGDERSREERHIVLQRVPSRNVQNRKADSGKPMLSIVLPAYNEAGTIKDVVADYFEEIVTKLPSKLVVAEDGSSDQTPEILSSLTSEIPISLFSSPIRKGYAKAVGDALKHCSEDWVFFSDSDGQYFSSDFWKLWENRNGCDMIIGCKVHRNEDNHRIVLSKVFHRIVNSLFGLNLYDGDSGFALSGRTSSSRLLMKLMFSSTVFGPSLQLEPV